MVPFCFVFTVKATAILSGASLIYTAQGTVDALPLIWCFILLPTCISLQCSPQLCDTPIATTHVNL